MIAGLGLTLLTAAAFVLSYDGLYATALAGGVRPSLAFLYPAIFDGFLVVAFAAAIVLRSGGLRATWYPWILIVVLLVAAAGANVMHALGRESLLPPDSMKMIVAAVPPVALGLAFPLWLLMFAYVRGGRRWRTPGDHPASQSSGLPDGGRVVPADIVPGLRHDDGPSPGGREDSGEDTQPDRQPDKHEDEREEAGKQADKHADKHTDKHVDKHVDKHADKVPASPSPAPSATPPSAKVRSSPTPPDD